MGESLKHIDWKKADIKSMQYILLHIKNSRKIRIKWLSLKGFILTKKVMRESSSVMKMCCMLI